MVIIIFQVFLRTSKNCENSSLANNLYFTTVKILGQFLETWNNILYFVSAENERKKTPSSVFLI